MTSLLRSLDDGRRRERPQEYFQLAPFAVAQPQLSQFAFAYASGEHILRATAYISSHLNSKLTLEEVGAEAFLSPSRFRHLFVEQTGMGLRPYILWRRFLKVWELAMAGESISGAAHAAGFADAAHLTRTCHRMSGFPPSALRVGRFGESSGA